MDHKGDQCLVRVIVIAFERERENGTKENGRYTLGEYECHFGFGCHAILYGANKQSDQRRVLDNSSQSISIG